MEKGTMSHEMSSERTVERLERERDTAIGLAYTYAHLYSVCEDGLMAIAPDDAAKAREWAIDAVARGLQIDPAIVRRVVGLD
jgi:hypothetical protein